MDQARRVGAAAWLLLPGGLASHLRSGLGVSGDPERPRWVLGRQGWDAGFLRCQVCACRRADSNTPEWGDWETEIAF